MWHREFTGNVLRHTFRNIIFATVSLGWKGFVYGREYFSMHSQSKQSSTCLGERQPTNYFRPSNAIYSILSPPPPSRFTYGPASIYFSTPSGFQPMFYIIGFTMALGWVTCSFRDKPWLLVVGRHCTIWCNSHDPLYSSGTGMVQWMGCPVHRWILLLQEQDFRNYR